MTGQVPVDALGAYVLEEEIGRGGMGIVYRARDKALRRVVAVKVLAPHLARQPEAVKRFVREARAAAAVKHPNIVQVYAVGKEKHLHFFAMEYVAGETLAGIVARQGRLEVEQALDITRQAACALAAAHRHDLVHRDIKPANIMVQPDGAVKVMDFGLARVLGDSAQFTKAGARLGTPSYMSPEQCQGRLLTCKSDLYSLGVTLHEMLCGHVPFAADNPLALMYQIIHEPVPDLKSEGASVPPGVERLAASLLAKNPEERPSAPRLAELLDRHSPELLSPIEHGTIPGMPEKSSEAPRHGSPSRRRVTRRRFIIGGVAAAALVLAGACTFLLTTRYRNPASPKEGRADDGLLGGSVASRLGTDEDVVRPDAGVLEGTWAGLCESDGKSSNVLATFAGNSFNCCVGMVCCKGNFRTAGNASRVEMDLFNIQRSPTIFSSGYVPREYPGLVRIEGNLATFAFPEPFFDAWEKTNPSETFERPHSFSNTSGVVVFTLRRQ